MNKIDVLQNDGDVLFTFLNDKYRVVCRIEDPVMQSLFSQKIAAPQPMVLREVLEAQYGDKAEETFNKVVGGIYGVADRVKTPLTREEMVNELLFTFSCFLVFRREVMDLQNDPQIYFALPPNQEKENEFLKTATMARDLASKIPNA